VYLATVLDTPPGSCVHLGQAFVATGSLTKAYGLSLRCGWIIADTGLARRIWRM
jgi:histidinol-phosphate/aromatic aminotransferase/cobyric acid decarboxylase-like protein